MLMLSAKKPCCKKGTHHMLRSWVYRDRGGSHVAELRYSYLHQQPMVENIAEAVLLQRDRPTAPI